MVQFSAREKGFHNEIEAVIDVDKDNEKLKKVWAKDIAENTIGAVGIKKWLRKANQKGSVEVDAISGASISTGAFRKAAIKAANEAGLIKVNTDAITGASQNDSHSEYNGIILTQALLNYSKKQGARFTYNTAVIGLIVSNDRHKVLGVVTEDHSRKLKYLKARRGVILATASIDQNLELAKDLSPQHYEDVKAHHCWSVQTDRGDGIVMGMSLGAAVTGFGGTIDFDARTGNGTDDRLPTIPSIFVNGKGLRFVNEDSTYAYGFRAIFNQEKQLNKPTYQIFGQTSISEEASPWSTESLDTDVKNGLVIKASSLKELSSLIDVPVNNLVNSVNTWNRNAAKGIDPEYDRTMGVKPFSGPYYAYKNTPGNLGAIGGLKINKKCNVLDIYQQPITGLYAAGLNAGGWIGSYYPGSGTAVGGVIHQGRRAAKSILGLE